MTCFWDGLMKGLEKNDFEKLHFKKTNRIDLINLLKQKNTETTNVLWNDKKIHKKELEENYIAVKNYDTNNIGNGHLCSTGDYMLLLICEIFNVNIYHKYLQNTMKYEKSNNKINLHFQSDKGHFWFVSRK